MMWSKSFINEYKTFYCQYTIELLHLLGFVFDNNYSTNENLRNMMIELAKRNDKCFYQLALATSLEEAHQKRENLGDFSDITNIDGNGLISKGLARKIAEQLDYLVKCEQNELYPSVYQIRMAGFPTRLNNQIIMLLSDLGVPNSVLLDLQDKWSNNKKQPPRCKIDMLKNKIPLPMNQCRYMFGYTLKSKLEPGQCFIRYQIVDDNGKPLKNPEFKRIVGSVIITKNPCPYAGDIMTLNAVDLPELDCLKDVIVFSTEGNQPDCNKIAGSDLDGDQYFAYWDQELRISETIEPLEYKAQSPSDHPTPITANGVVNYCLSLLGAISHGEIYNLHAIVVDQNKEKHPKRTCQKLAIEMAEMFSAAINSGKTGYQIDANRIREIRKIVGHKYPDFLMKTSLYQSEPILDILYRKTLNFKTQNPQLFEGQDINDSINTSAKKDANTTQSIASSNNTSFEDIKAVCSQMYNNLHITNNEIQENVNMNSDTNEKAKAPTDN
ncbi:unnamed protein product [Rotaria sordida]|uniref:RNA-dependent RNA polymerase n=2 Tax=Rotaria sordida TaxID=392033 RepID=A0A814J5Q2_9BILA|nr:unnamed protein product [Rotaria sordida]